jgi:hypothetical protein
MASTIRWHMDHSLALAREGDVLEVKEILFGGLRDHLRQIGVREGATLEHLGMGDGGVEVRLGDGRGVRVHPDYAWFLVVEPRTKREIMEE